MVDILQPWLFSPPVKKGRVDQSTWITKSAMCYVASSVRSWTWLSVGGCADQTAKWLSQECLSFYKWTLEPEMNFFTHFILCSLPNHTPKAAPPSLSQQQLAFALCSLEVPWELNE